MKLTTLLGMAVCVSATMTCAYAQPSPRQLANAAATALEKKDYAAAISGYRAARDGGYRDATLMYDLAAAHLKAGNEAEALAAHASPEQFKFITSDLDRFWKVFEQLPASSAPAQLLDQQYLDAGSVGLHGFIPHRIGSGANLYASISKRPKYYARTRPN